MGIRFCSRILTVAFVLSSSLALAQTSDSSSTMPSPQPVTSYEQWKPHLGLIAGTVVPEGSYDPGAGYGVDIGFQPYIPLSAGLEITQSRNEGRQELEDIKQTAVLLKGAYNFGGNHFLLKNSYAGLAVGQVYKSGHTDIAGAPLVGFDIPLSEKTRNFLTLGASAKYLIINGNDPDVLNINGAVKYWY